MAQPKPQPPPQPASSEPVHAGKNAVAAAKRDGRYPGSAPGAVAETAVDHARVEALARLAHLFRLRNATRPSGGSTEASPANPLLAALAEQDQGKRQATSRAAAQVGQQVADPAEAPAPPNLIDTADLTAQPQSHGARVGADDAAGADHLSPKQIILQRGYWAGVPPSEAARQPSKQPSAADAQTTTGSIGLSASLDGPASGVLPLAYARQPAAGAFAGSRRSAALSALKADLPGPAAQRLRRPPPATTIALESTAREPVSVVVSAPVRRSPSANKQAAAAARSQERLADPWLLAVMVSPSVRRFMTTLRLGPQNFRALAPLMRKPRSAVMMTFGPEPDPGLTPNGFSGKAVVSLSTETFAADAAALK